MFRYSLALRTCNREVLQPCSVAIVESYSTTLQPSTPDYGLAQRNARSIKIRQPTFGGAMGVLNVNYRFNSLPFFYAPPPPLGPRIPPGRPPSSIE